MNYKTAIALFVACALVGGQAYAVAGSKKAPQKVTKHHTEHKRSEQKKVQDSKVTYIRQQSDFSRIVDTNWDSKQLRSVHPMKRFPMNNH